MNGISIFSGCGGLDLGFTKAGFNIHFSSDIMSEGCETMRNNFNHYVYGPPSNDGDVHNLTKSIIQKSGNINKIDFIIGGPPCQSFSVAAAQRFLKNDTKFKRKGFGCQKNGLLIYEYLRLVDEIKPKFFLIENVPGILKVDGSETISGLYETFENIGYNMTQPIFVQAADYGVPQFRERVFLFGTTLNRKLVLPEPSHSNADTLSSTKKYSTVAQAINDIPKYIPNNETRNHKSESVSRYQKLKIGQREKLGRVDRLDPNKPSKTVIAGGSNGGGRSHLHPFLARTLSVRECARLQTFPDDFVFYGKTARQFTQVGNAVPPLIGELIAKSIMSSVLGKKVSNDYKLEKGYIGKNVAVQHLLEKSKLVSEYKCYSDV